MVYNWRFWIPWDCCGHWQAFGFRMTHKHTERMIKLSMRQLIPWHLMHQMKIIKPNDAITVIKSQSPHIHDSVKCGVDHIQCTHIHSHTRVQQPCANESINSLSIKLPTYDHKLFLSNLLRSVQFEIEIQVVQTEFINQYIGNPLSFLVRWILVKLFHSNLPGPNTRESFVPMKISTETSCIDVEPQEKKQSHHRKTVGRIEGNW